MRTLYPEIKPYHSHRYKVDEIHEIYCEESGNPSGIPVIFLHGGPGQGSSENHRRYFDPNHYRIINFDQRGCHRSSPRGEVRNNATQYLLDDLDLIRTKLNIDKWLIFGGSWGATLGLLYAQTQPQCITGMILRGTFLARQREKLWFFENGVNRIFPDLWEKFRTFIPAHEQHDLVKGYYKRLISNDQEMMEQAARYWSDWTSTIVTYSMAIDGHIVPDDATEIINQSRIETHYGSHEYFIKENQILTDIKKIPDVPIFIIHGRKDLTCTVDAAWELHKALPGSDLNIVKQGGHLASQPIMTDALIKATDDMVMRLV